MKSFKTFISEMAPPPDDWNTDIFKQSFEAQLEYAREKANQIGRGSSRVVFEVMYNGRMTALKIAKNEKGLAQNKEEAFIMSTANSDVVIPIIDYDTENNPPTWIHMEKAENITEADFERITGFNFTDFCDLILNNTSGMSLPPNDKYDVIVESDLFNDVLSLVFDFQLFPSDLELIYNWGLYNGRIVLIDVGATDDVVNTLY